MLKQLMDIIDKNDYSVDKKLTQNGKYHRSNIHQNHHNTLDAVDLLRQREDIDQYRGCDEDHEIDHRRKVHRDRMDRRRHAEDQQKIKDIGTDNITDRQTVLTFA